MTIDATRPAAPGVSITPPALVAPGCQEQALSMPCGQDKLLGILSASSSDGAASAAQPEWADLALVVVVGGPQYRAGSHRLFVQLCRHLAAQGLATLRFDVRGMGDSSGGQRSFEQLSDDIAVALHALQCARPAVRRVVLWGLCDGASAALLYLHERADPRVVGLCLLNPWVRSEATLARTHLKHYYLQRLKAPDFWRKLLRGGVAGKAVRELWQSLRLARPAGARNGTSPEERQRPFIERMALGLQRSALPTLLVLSGQDLTAREFEDVSRSHPAWIAAMRQGQPLHVHRLSGADHTLSSTSDAEQLMHACTAWIRDTWSRRSDQGAAQAKAAA